MEFWGTLKSEGAWIKRLQTAKVIGTCDPDVPCEFCNRAGDTRIVQTEDTSAISYICDECLTNIPKLDT